VDSTANDVPDPRFAVKGFPTLYLQTAAGDVVSYSGDRSEDSLIAFVNEHKSVVKEVKEVTEEEAVPPTPAPEVHDEL